MTGTTDSTSLRVRTTWKCILSTDSTSIRNRRSSPPVSGSGTQVRWMSSLASLNLELGFIPRQKSLIIHKRGHTKTSKKLCMNSELLSIYRKGNQVLSHQPRSISKWQQGGRVISQLWKADVTKKDTRPIVSFSTSRCLSTSRRREARQPPISLNPWRCTIVSLLWDQYSKALTWLGHSKMSRRMLSSSRDPSLLIQVSALIIMAPYLICELQQAKGHSSLFGRGSTANRQKIGTLPKNSNQRRHITGHSRFSRMSETILNTIAGTLASRFWIEDTLLPRVKIRMIKSSIKLCKLTQRSQKLPMVAKGAGLKERVQHPRARNDSKSSRTQNLTNRPRVFLSS